MKNGIVLEHHFGDDGDTPQGMILLDVTNKRFEELEKKGLIREATADEVKKGYAPPFVAEGDVSAPEDGFAAQIAAARAEVAASAQQHIDDLTETHAAALSAAIGRADALDLKLAEAVAQIGTLEGTVANECSRADETAKLLADAQEEIVVMKAAADKPEEKKAEEPANKAAPTPANKAK